MKKHRLIWLLPVLALLVCTAARAAEQPEEKPEPTQEQLAQMLHALHLLQGTERGFELDRPLTRAEAAVLVTRFFGGEQEALERRYPTKFTDVPAWAAPYVGWLYHWGLTNGTSATRYGSGRTIRFAEYCVLLNRRFDTQSYDECLRYGCQVADADTLRQKGDLPLLRGEGIAVSAGALRCILMDEDRSLVEKLLEQGVFTGQELEQAAAPLYGYTYSGVYADDDTGRIVKKVLDVAVAGSDALPGFATVYVYRPEGFLFVYVENFQSAACYLYRVDCDTLAAERIAQLTDGGNPAPWGQQGAWTVFVELMGDGNCRVLASDGNVCNVIQGPGLFYNNNYQYPSNIYLNAYRVRDLAEGLFLCCDAGLYRVNGTATALEQVATQLDGIRDVTADGTDLYYTAYTVQRSADNWQRTCSSRIWKRDAQGNTALWLDTGDLGLSPDALVGCADGKLYFEAYDYAHFSPKGYICYEYCFDGQRVYVAGARGDGDDVAAQTAEELGRREQQRLDALYQAMGR